MEIYWHGHSCFTIKSKDATLVTDPFLMGTELPKLKADIVTLGGEGEITEVEGNPKILGWPGEFEVAGISIEAFKPNGDEANIFLFQIDGLHVCHLGYISHELSDEVLNRIGDVDILMVPVGGGIVLDGKMAQKVVEAIEPRIVIPMVYAATKTKLQISGAEEFLKAVGKSELTPVEKFSVQSRASLPEESMEFVLLEPKL
jgi:L-ascorbate metabolism protein UlaG (beta-lactamase superfamily)